MSIVIDQLAAEVAAQERVLRGELRQLLQSGDVQQALFLLEEWDQASAGEVLLRNGCDKNGRTG